MPILSDHRVLQLVRDIQAERPNLVIYSRLANAIVEVAWPMKADGAVILATGVKDWLRKRGLFIECLCPLVLELSSPRVPYSCRLVETMGGDVMAYCNKEDNGCGMRVNLSIKVKESIQDVSKYEHFKPSKGAMVNYESQMNNILELYRNAGHPNHETAPLLIGYIGEHVSFYQEGAVQLAGSPLIFGARRGVVHLPADSRVTTFRGRYQYHPNYYREHSLPDPMPKLKYREIGDIGNPSATLPSEAEMMAFNGHRVGEKSRAATRLRKRQSRVKSEQAVAGPSRLPDEAIEISSGDDSDVIIIKRKKTDHHLIDSLVAGEGLTRRQVFNELLESCKKCSKYVLQTEIASHEKDCLGRMED